MTVCYREVSPGDSLACWVECGWSVETAAAIPGHRVPPDGCLDLIYDRRNGLRAVGAMTVEQRFYVAAGACAAGVRFQPGMAGPFLRLSPAELTDRSAALDDLWPRRAREMARRLDDAGSSREAMRILLDGLPRPAVAPSPVQRAIQAVAAANGDIDLDGMARAAGLSPRQFRRRCLEESGLTPKHLCRVLRFRHAQRLALWSGRPDWAAIAAEAHYYDQAHLIRDFREFTGASPMAVFSNTAPGYVG